MKQPKISERAILANNAVVCGDVTIGEDSSVWFHATVRAESAGVTIGKRSNIQDNCVLHVDVGNDLIIGDQVTVGHGAILHGCTIGDGSLIGMGSIILNGAKVGKHCIIGAGALITQGTVIPDGSLAFGNPARVKRPLSEEEIAVNLQSAEDYVAEALDYQENGYFHFGK